MSIDEDIGDPASLPTRDGRPVPRGEEIEICGTCFWCRLRLMDKKTPYAACTVKVPMGAGVPDLYIIPTDLADTCNKWRAAHPEFNDYADQLWFWRWRSRCKNDFDCHREEQEYRRLEAQDNEQALKEEYKKFGPKPRPIIGG